MALKKPVDWDELYPGRFLKAGELGDKPVTLTITDVNLEELEGDSGKKIKGVISFEKTPKMLALNKTNGICLRAMFGRRIPEWEGKRVTLFRSQWNGEECIRVYGSPDIAEDIAVQVQLPRRKPIAMTMHRTGQKTGANSGPRAPIPSQDDPEKPAVQARSLVNLGARDGWIAAETAATWIDTINEAASRGDTDALLGMVRDLNGRHQSASISG